MTDAEQPGTSAQMLELATGVEQCLLYKGVPGLGVFRMHEADQKLIVAALRTVASQDARSRADAVALADQFESECCQEDALIDRPCSAFEDQQREINELKDQIAALRAQPSPGVLTGFDASQDAREALKCELRINSAADYRSWADIERAFNALSSLPQSAPALSPSQQAERLPSSDAAEAGADAVALAGKIETIDRLFAREEYDADSAALSLMRDIWDDLKSAALAAPQPQAPISECCREDSLIDRPCSAFEDQQREINKLENEIAALRAQPQAGAREPVAWRVRSYLDQYEITTRKERADEWTRTGLDVEPLYATPSPIATGRQKP